MLRIGSLFLIAASLVMAQSSNSADLQGTVTDAAGAVIPGAGLTVTHIETRVSRSGATNSLGRYRFPALPVGSYDLVVSKEGFASVERKGLVLQVGQLATIDVEMPIATQVQRVVVEAAAPIVEAGQVAAGAVVDRREIDELPINGRNFLDFSRTVAGVTAQQTSGEGSGLSFNGQRARSNNLSIDGVESNGELNGNTRLTMSQDAVQEFQVVTNMYAPEFGNAGGGLVNVVSRSGTNDFHGNLFYLQRNEALDGRNAFATDAKRPRFRRRNQGATLGGPAVRNKTFFFAAVEYIRRDESGQTTISPGNVAQINAALAAHPIPNGGVKSIATGTFPIGQITTLASIKLDHSFNQNNSVTFRYIFPQDRQTNTNSTGGTTDLSGGGGQKTRDQSFVGSWTHVFSPTLLSESRFQYAPRNLEQTANDPIGPAVSISGVASFGRNTSYPVLLDETHHELTQSVSKQTGRHSFKFGADINFIRAHTSYPSTFGGSFSFASLAAFVAGQPQSFTQGFGNPAIRLPENLLGFYAQDTFRVNQKLTLVYGLRYDYDMQPQNVPRNRNNPIEAPLQDSVNRYPKQIAPRFGATYNPDGKGKTVIRAGYGLYFDKIFLLVARNSLIARNTASFNTAAQAQARWPLGAFPPSDTFPTGLTIPKPSLNTVDSNMTMPYAQNTTFGIQREVARNWAVGAEYVYVHGVHLLRSMNLNLGPPTVLTAANARALGVAAPTPQQLGRNYYGAAARPNPDFTNIHNVTTGGNSAYNGLQLTLQKRFSHGFQVRANYTFSKTIDDTSDFTQAQQPQDPIRPGAERSLSLEDQRHRFTMTGVWDLPYHARTLHFLLGGWVLSTNWTYRSGTPRNVTVGSDVNGDGNSNDRPLNGDYVMGRNIWMGPESFTVDARLSKRFRIRERFSVRILAEAFNIENRVNYSGVNTTWGTALAPRTTLGMFTSAGSPRQVEFGAKIEF
jgi:hypothetical protein